jgi:hypothetical protein
MQAYMMGAGDDRALYYAICKDDDRIYTERVRFDKAVAQKAIDRGYRLVKADRMPPPISTDPTWFECRFCAAHEFCHKTKLTKEVNCRTCTNSTAREDGTWHCEQYDVALDFENQKQGCEAHVLHPDLVPWQHKVEGKAIIWMTPHGDIKNGVSDWETFTSREIVANAPACASRDKFVDEAREIFGAKVVG